ncbi:MAG TPA: TlpA disulfide reductase family protein [Candidatus Koribacter sp.]|jgi:thiol-disulfide isomerase/thioredoxin
MRVHRQCLLFVLLVCTAFAGSDSDIGQPAPRFNAKTLAGEKFTNDSLRGKVVLLQFWATWCKYCRRDQPLVDALDKEFAPQGLVTLAIDVGEDKGTVKKYLQQNPRTVRIVLTGDTNLAAMFNSRSFPIYVVVDRDGKVAAEQHGAGGELALRHLLRKAGLDSKDDGSSSDSAN